MTFAVPPGVADDEVSWNRAMNRFIFLVVLLGYTPTLVATTGWDRHDVRVGSYRIHGKNGASYVHRVNEAGESIEPPLCSNGSDPRFQSAPGPPDYALTGTHLAIRYQTSTSDSVPTHCYYLIRTDNDLVTGPWTEAEFSQADVVKKAEPIAWSTPPTPGDPVSWFTLGLAACFSLSIVGASVIFAVALVLRVRRSHKK